MAQLNANKGNNSARKRERFVKIAERRVNKILDSIDTLSKCSNKRNYEYTDKEVRKIFREIERRLKETKLLFLGSNESKAKFKL